MKMALRRKVQAACSSPSSGLWRERLARKEFAGWARSDKLWGKRIANSLEKGMMPLRKPSGVKRSLQEPCPRLPMGCGCPYQQDGGPGCEEQGGETRRDGMSPAAAGHRPAHLPSGPFPAPLAPEHPDKAKSSSVILRPLKNGSAGEAECIWGTTPKCYSIKACRVWVRDGSPAPTPILSSTCSIWIDAS